MTRTLVAGSYPPVPGPASAATLRAVRSELARGAEVEVISPRPSAAHYVESLRGPSAARAIRRRGRAIDADTVVLCVEPGIPFEPGTSERRVRIQTAMLVAAMRRFRRVVVLVPAGLSERDAPARRLWARADALVVPGEAERARTVQVAGVREANVLVEAGEATRGEIRIPLSPNGTVTEVTAYGPPNAPENVAFPRLRARLVHYAHLSERAAYRLEHRAARWARAVLGDHAGIVGRPLRAMTAPVRTAILRVTRRSSTRSP